MLVSGQVSGFQSTGVHRTQGGGGSGIALVGGSSKVITGQDQGRDQGLDGGDGLHIIRQVSQEHLCVEEEFHFFPLFINYSNWEFRLKKCPLCRMWGQKCKIIIFTVFSFAYNCLNLRVIVFSCLRMSQPRMDKPNTGF